MKIKVRAEIYIGNYSFLNNTHTSGQKCDATAYFRETGMWNL
jgi:hypothetical protein